MLIVTGFTRQNIYLRRSNTFILDLQYRNPTTNSPINTQQFQGFLQLRPYEGSTNLFFEANTTNGMITFSGADGGIHIEIDYTTTLNLPDFDKATYGFLVIDKNNRATSLLEGLAEIESTSVYYGTPRPSVGLGSGTQTDYNLSAAELDWTQILNKPTFSAVSFSGDFHDLINAPIFTGAYKDLTGIPQFARIATTGSYNDLKDVPQTFAPAAHTHTYDSITNKPNPLAFRGTWSITTSYNANNFVFKDGSTYVALSDNNGVEPANNYVYGSPRVWQLVSQGSSAITTSQISDFDTAVRAYTLSQFALPTQSININGQLIVNSQLPVNPGDLANKQYVDNVIQGLSPKASVYAATTADLSPGYTNSGNVLTASANGALTVDTVAPPINARVLLKNAGTPSLNGIYVVTDPGSSTTPYILTRAADFNAWSEVLGAFVLVEFGNTNAASGWIASVATTGTINTTAIGFVPFSSAASGTVTNGNGLGKSGSTLFAVGTTNRIAVGTAIDIDSNYAGQSSITILGTVGTGVWQGTTIGLAYGGTGGTTQATARASLAAAKNGANSDITALTGLTTMLALSQGGTGRDCSQDPDGTIYKKSGTTLVPAVAGTDYAVPGGSTGAATTTNDGGTF